MAGDRHLTTPEWHVLGIPSKFQIIDGPKLPSDSVYPKLGVAWRAVNKCNELTTQVTNL